MCRFSVNGGPLLVLVTAYEAVLKRNFTIFLDLLSKQYAGVLLVLSNTEGLQNLCHWPYYLF